MKLPIFLNKNIISIDIGSYETKIIEAKKSYNSIQVHKAFSFLTPDGCYENGHIKNERALIDAMKTILKKNKISSKIAYLTIKSTEIITREIPFPVVEPKEIEGMLKYQVEEYLPMDVSRYVVQHKIIGKVFDGEKERVNVLVVAIPKEIVEKHFFLLTELNLKPAVLDYQSNSISKLIWFADSINDGTFISDKTIAAIDLGNNSTNVSIIKNGRLQTSRAIEIGGEDLDNNILSFFELSKKELLEEKLKIEDISVIEEGYTDYNRLINITKTTIENIIDKAERIVKYYTSKEIENEINVIILYGGLSKLNGVDKLFSSYFSINTVILDSINKVNIQVDPIKYLNCISSLLRDEEV